MSVPPSLVVSRKAEHRNSDEDGQDNIRGNDAYYCSNVYYVTGAKICDTEARLWQQNQNPHTITIPASQGSNMLRRVTYLAVLLQTLKDEEFVKHQTKNKTKKNPITATVAHCQNTHRRRHSPNNEPTIQRASDIFLMCVFFFFLLVKEEFRRRGRGPPVLLLSFKWLFCRTHKQNAGCLRWEGSQRK